MQAQSHASTSKAPEEQESMDALHAVASALLQQACEMLEEVAKMHDGEKIMTFESKHIPGSTIGKHLRHALDHYRLLVEAAAASTPLELNYDHRTRLLEMERIPAAALEQFQNIDRQLGQAVSRMRMDTPVRLTALTPHHQEFNTSFGRELWFVALHAIHHFSLLRVIACGELHLTLPDNFGVAPSTIAFRQYAKEQDDKDMPQEQLEKGAKKVAGKVKL